MFSVFFVKSYERFCDTHSKLLITESLDKVSAEDTSTHNHGRHGVSKYELDGFNLSEESQISLPLYYAEVLIMSIVTLLIFVGNTGTQLHSGKYQL